MKHYSDELMADVLGALDDTYRSANEIARRVDKWSPVTLRHALTQLGAAGEIDCIKETTPVHFRRMYRRKQ